MLNKIYYEGNLNDITKKLDEREEDIDKEVSETVKAILDDVKTNGDLALIKYAEKFDGFKIAKIADIKVTRKRNRRWSKGCRG